MNPVIHCNPLKKSSVFALSLFLILYGCSAFYGLSVGKQDDFFLELQLKYLEDTDKYIDSVDSRFKDLLKYGSLDFVTKRSISGKKLRCCEILNRQPVIFGLAYHIEYADKWRYLVIAPYHFYRRHSETIPNQRQVFVMEIPRRPKTSSWSVWEKPDFIGDLPETSFVLLYNHKEYLSHIEGPPYFELRYRVVTGTMRGGVLSIKDQK